MYGRPGTPMPAWGAEGGGPLTTQQIDELIAYLESIQLTSDQAKAQVEEAVRSELGLGEGAPIDYTDPAVGKTLFNLGMESGEAGGAFACARCHTKGASFRYGAVEPVDADLSEYTGFPDGSGRSASTSAAGSCRDSSSPSTTSSSSSTTAPSTGCSTASGGRAAAACPASATTPTPRTSRRDDGMFTDGMLRAVALYEASLGDSIGAGVGGGSADEADGVDGSGNAEGGSEAEGDADQVDGTTNTTEGP